MKKMLLAVAVTTSLLFVSCNSGGGDPKTVLMSFFEALSKKDFTAAKKLATKDSEAMFSMIEMGMQMNKDNKDMDKYDKEKMEFGETKIDGDKATVAVKDKTSGESTNFILKKESGNWKVAFDKASLMQMGTDKIKEKGMSTNDMIDSAQNGLEKLKEMNPDSLANKMKEGMDKLKEIQEKNPEAMKQMQEAVKKMQEAQKNQ
ncbi:nuclear transport factor 2 family protein [Ferruginibacter profundus]